MFLENVCYSTLTVCEETLRLHKMLTFFILKEHLKVKILPRRSNCESCCVGSLKKTCAFICSERINFQRSLVEKRLPFYMGPKKCFVGVSLLYMLLKLVQ